MKIESMSEQLEVLLPETLKQRLKSESELTGNSMSAIVRQVLSDFFRKKDGLEL